MKNKISYYFDLAADIATSKKDARSFLVGAVAVRNDGVLIASPNGPTDQPNRMSHAEYRVCKKMDHSAIIYVARVYRGCFEFAMARPCDNCRKVLISRRVRKVFYTISEREYGAWNPITNKDSYFTIN